MALQLVAMTPEELEQANHRVRKSASRDLLDEFVASGERASRIEITGEDAATRKAETVVANLRNAINTSRKNGSAYPVKVSHRAGQIRLERTDVEDEV